MFTYGAYFFIPQIPEEIDEAYLIIDFPHHPIESKLIRIFFPEKWLFAVDYNLMSSPYFDIYGDKKAIIIEFTRLDAERGYYRIREGYKSPPVNPATAALRIEDMLVKVKLDFQYPIPDGTEVQMSVTYASNEQGDNYTYMGGALLGDGTTTSFEINSAQTWHHPAVHLTGASAWDYGGGNYFYDLIFD